MSVTRLCEQCGKTLPPRAPGGLCPKCLLAQAVDAAIEPANDDQPATQKPILAVADFSARRFGDYELLDKIAEGGMGAVYRARQLSLNRIVAVKMIQPGRVGSPEMVLRFRAEAEAAASLHHPNIVPIYETSECEGQHYFSMGFIEGKNLAEVVREGPLPPARAAQLLEKTAAAVHHAHQHGILHRDLKPSNVILDDAGEPHVTDFGLARRLSGESTLTLTGQVFGSPRFMPPEQASSRPGAVGVHSDIYGLGAILYYLLTAQALADELGRFLRGEPIQARPVSRAEQVWRWCRRKPLVAGLAAGLMFALVLGFAGVLRQWQRAKASELFARQNAYAADMKLAQLALLDNDVGQAVSLLNKHRPTDSSLATRHSPLATCHCPPPLGVALPVAALPE